jgi:hypothetical protein
MKTVPEVNMKGETGLGLAILWVQQALISILWSAWATTKKSCHWCPIVGSESVSGKKGVNPLVNTSVSLPDFMKLAHCIYIGIHE